MSNWSEEQLAAAVTANPDLARRNGARLTRTAVSPAPATSRPPEAVSPVEAKKNPKADASKNQRQVALAMSEADLQQSIIVLAHAFGYRIAHFRSVQVTKKDGSTFWQTPVAADGEGWPDLILARPGRLIAVECKKQREKPRPNQVAWAELLLSTKRIEVYIFRPSDWLDGTVEALLR